MFNDSYYNNHTENAHFDVIIEGGKMIDIKTEDEIVLKDGYSIKIIVPLSSLEKNVVKAQLETTKKKLLKSGDALYFRFTSSENGNTIFEFNVILQEDLYLSQKGNKHNSFDECRCIVELTKTGDRFEASSLNQAFFQASVKYRPANKSHTCNVFKTFFYDGSKLDDLRFIEQNK